MPTLNLDPITTMLIAAVALALFVGLLAYLSRRTVKQSDFYFNGRTKKIPDTVLRKLLNYLTPAERARVGQLLQRQRNGERLSERDYAWYTVAVGQAISRLIDDDPGAAYHFRDML
ncbi:hypothetical protein [Chloroflexus sp.]|uniref:hypothetical protein n=1 Tax=Chloroflexus sp. TaxID=1904827 RepID=UPI002ACD3283|nr:hypothetical protein [Chloroflexus sp.]